jgi:hypothetical protein
MPKARKNLIRYSVPFQRNIRQSNLVIRPMFALPAPASSATCEVSGRLGPGATGRAEGFPPAAPVRHGPSSSGGTVSTIAEPTPSAPPIEAANTTAHTASKKFRQHSTCSTSAGSPPPRVPHRALPAKCTTPKTPNAPRTKKPGIRDRIPRLWQTPQNSSAFGCTSQTLDITGAHAAHGFTRAIGHVTVVCRCPGTLAAYVSLGQLAIMAIRVSTRRFGAEPKRDVIHALADSACPTGRGLSRPTRR